MANRFVQRLAVVLVLLSCTSLLYLHQSSSFRSHPLPQSVGAHHYTKVSRDYSVKPLAYIFPQYYTFPDNDRLHGKNFTEWSNVRRVTKNRYGLETIRPHKSIGFYDGLSLETRHRYGQFLKDYGFHGAVFHHYWFAGRPVMEHVIEKMLEDGEPDIPFMLSWANEPWSARWDGSGGNGGILIAQEYGLVKEWRAHFDWLLPFFRHPKYIRSEGKVQFVVYNPMHAGHLGPHMWAAFRQWAVEEGLGGMDIIETRWGPFGSESWAGHPPDAVNEFHPHVNGRDHAKFPSESRLSRVYHRGTLACWDTTPRHPTDDKDVSEPLCHPRRWQWHLVEMLQRIKSEPNPIGSENFLFINALNEWGEGNCVEPSRQFGDGYGIAMKNALEISDREHVWADTQIEDAIMQQMEVAPLMNQTADVCVIVRTTTANAEDRPYKLTAMLRSLQSQNNQNWRAVVVQTDQEDFWGLDQLVLRSLDARVRYIQVPDNATSVTQKYEDGTRVPGGDQSGFETTDWLLKNMTDADAWNLTDADAGCARAKYLLVADGGDRFEPTAFDSVMGASNDMIGLNVESRETLWNHAQLQVLTWNDTCTRLENTDLQLWNTSLPTRENFDLSATFLNFSKFRSEGNSFWAFAEVIPSQELGALAEYLATQRSWSFATTTDNHCHVYHNPAYTQCLKSGNFWFDSPIYSEQGCYTSDQFQEIFGKEDHELKNIDLQFFREHGNCVRYEREAYEDALMPKVEVDPEPAPLEAEAAPTSPPAEEELSPEIDDLRQKITALEEELKQKDLSISQMKEEKLGQNKQLEEASVQEAPKAELMKDGDPEAVMEFAPGVVSDASTVSMTEVPSPTARR